MQVHFGVELIEAEWAGAVAVIGTFDGVHLGHQAVISQAVAEARNREMPCVLLTFDRHPAAILAPEKCPLAIASLGDNLRQFEKLGVNTAVVLHFDKKLSETTADDFLQHFLIEKIRTSKLVVGHDFAFGHDREGTPEWLQGRIETQVIPPFQQEGIRVSSSAVRKAIAEGRMEEATHLLGRAWEIGGVVIPGQRLGRDLGYPTANIARSFHQILPTDGVYAGVCQTPYGPFKSAVSIGLRPTIGDAHRTIEAYLLDYPGKSLYGHSVSLAIDARLRGQENFGSLDDLKEQIARDVEIVASRP